MISLKVTLPLLLCLQIIVCPPGPEKHHPHPEDNFRWGEWSAWSNCRGHHGIGEAHRSRKCYLERHEHEERKDVEECKHHLHEEPEEKLSCIHDETGNTVFVEQLHPHPHPDGHDTYIGYWASWTACSVTCGKGSATRSRFIYKGDGKILPSHDYQHVHIKTSDIYETQECQQPDCPVPINGSWSNWGHFGPCSTTCGDGNATRSRSCSNPPPSNGGLPCIGDTIETSVCSSQPCVTPSVVINGSWSNWGNYSACSNSCGGGKKLRSRTCSNPPPSKGGLPCFGDSIDMLDCNTQSCTVNGSWSSWMPFEPCTATCGGGIHLRHRSCTNPSPSNGGLPCIGDSLQATVCNLQQCVNGNPVTTNPITQQPSTTKNPLATINIPLVPLNTQPHLVTIGKRIINNKNN